MDILIRKSNKRGGVAVASLSSFYLWYDVYPHESAIKPRLPLKAVFHENSYEDKQTELKEYNEIISAYYNERTNGLRQDRWTEQIIGMLTSKQREFMMDFVKSKRFALK